MTLRIQTVPQVSETAAASFEWEIPEVYATDPDGGSLLRRGDFLALRHLLNRAEATTPAAGETKLCGRYCNESPDQIKSENELPVADRQFIKRARANLFAVDFSSSQESKDRAKQQQQVVLGACGRASDDEAINRCVYAEIFKSIIDLRTMALVRRGRQYDVCNEAIAPRLREQLYATHGQRYLSGAGKDSDSSPYLLFELLQSGLRQDDGQQPEKVLSKVAVIYSGADWLSLDDSTSGPTINIEADIQVFLDGESTPRVVPLGTSLKDFQNKYGVVIKGFRRDARRVCSSTTVGPAVSCTLTEYPETKDTPNRLGTLADRVMATSGVSFGFDGYRPPTRAKSIVSLAGDTRPLILLAHRDVLFVANARP